MAKLDTEMRVVADLDVMPFHDPEVERQARLARKLQDEFYERATERAKAEWEEVEDFYRGDDSPIDPKQLGRNEADREQYLDAQVPKRLDLDPNGERAVTTPGSRLCYICLRGFPTTDELTAHIGLEHHGRTAQDVERAIAADDMKRDLPEPLKEEVAAWRAHSRDEAEDRKHRAIRRAYEEVLDEGEKLTESYEVIIEDRRQLRANLEGEEQAKAEFDVQHRVWEAMSPRAVVEEEALHDRAEHPQGEPLRQARARLKSLAISVNAQEALYEQDVRDPLRVRKEQEKVDERHESGFKDLLVMVGDPETSGRLVSVEERPDEILKPGDQVVVERAQNALPEPAPRDPETTKRIERMHPDPTVEERLETEERIMDGRTPRAYEDKQESVMRENMLTNNAGDPSGEPVQEHNFVAPEKDADQSNDVPEGEQSSSAKE